MNACVITAQAVQGMFHQTRQLFGQFWRHGGRGTGGKDRRGRRGGAGGLCVGPTDLDRSAGTELGVAHEHALHRQPVFLGDGRFKLAQQTLLCGCLSRNDPQNLPQRTFRKRRRGAAA